MCAFYQPQAESQSGLHAALVFARSAFQGLSHTPSQQGSCPLSLTPATCPKHFLTTLRLYSQQNADQHDLLIRIHGSPCDSSQLKIFHEKWPERVKLSRGESSLPEGVPSRRERGLRGPL